jgi:hypothetical protein
MMTDPAVRQWLGWAVILPRDPWLYVEYCADEATVWKNALGFPSDDEIAHAKANGARAFPVVIVERAKTDSRCK